MGDSAYPIGQNVPAGQYGSYPARAPKAASGSPNVSFQSMLNQQQQPNMRTSANQLASNTPQTSGPVTNALPPQFAEETLALMQNMPHRLQPGEDIQNKILQNQHEYQQMKAAKSGPQPTEQPSTAPQQIASGPTAAS